MKMKVTLLLLLLLALGGCVLPKPPKWYTVSKTERFGVYQSELHTIYQGTPADRHNTDSGPSVIKTPKRNALFIALDESVQPQFGERLMEVYKTEREVRLEDVSWWRFAPKFNGLYDKVARIPWNAFHRESFVEAVKLMEALGRPYDIYLLTHGLPNHITTTQGHPFIGYQDLAALEGIMKRAQMVYLQGCFSNTIAADFHDLGVETVLSFEGWNRNFFFVDFFIKRLRRYNHNALKAFRETNGHIKRDFKLNILYRKLLKELGLTIDEYLEQSPSPIFSERQK